MKTISLKDQDVSIKDEDLKYLELILETTGYKDLKSISLSEFNIAMNVEKLCNGETIQTPKGKMRFKS